MILVFTEKGENAGTSYPLIKGEPIYKPDPKRGWNLEDLRHACESSGLCPKEATGAHVRLDDNGVTYLIGYYL